MSPCPPRLLAALLLCLASAAHAQSKTLAELVHSAETKNFALVESRSLLRKAEADVTQSRSALLPRLSLQSDLSYEVTPGRTWTSQAGLVLSQNLFDGGVSWAELTRARLRRDQALLDVKATEEEMAFKVIKAYIECATVASNRQAIRRKVSVLEQQFELINRLFRQGKKTQRDYRLLEADVEGNRLKADKLEIELYAAFRNLESVAGLESGSLSPDSLVLLNGEKALSLPGWKVSHFDFDARRENLELKSLELNIEVNDSSVAQARRLYLPTLSVNAGAGYGSHGFIGAGTPSWSSGAEWSTSVSLNLKWTLWDWGGVPAGVARARADQLIANKRLEQRQLEVTNDYATLKRKLEQQARIVEVQRRIRQLEGESFKTIESEYREGRIGYLDLTSAIEREIVAETSFEAEAYTYFLSVAEYYKLKGTLYENIKTL